MIRLLVDVVVNYLDLAVSTFPKVATMTSKLALEFCKLRHGKLGTLRDAFSELALGNKEMTTLIQSNGINASEMRFLYNGIALDIEDILHRVWCSYNYTASNPPIVIPSATKRVHKYSQSALYYIAGWIIVGMYDREDVCESVALLRMAEFAACHTITASQAKNDMLPTDTLDARETMHLRRLPSKAFYNFVGFLECIYMHNMNVEMMMAYSAGYLLSAIRKIVRYDETVKECFIGLLRVLLPPEEDSVESSKMSDEMMEFVIRKYAKMRGRWLFAKALSGRRTKVLEQLRTCPPETKL